MKRCYEAYFDLGWMATIGDYGCQELAQISQRTDTRVHLGIPDFSYAADRNIAAS